MVKTIPITELKEVLLFPKEARVKEPYYLIHATGEEKITIVSVGKNGIEFNKTYGYFHEALGVEIYRCLYGQGLIIMQRNDIEGEAKEFKVSFLRFGMTIEVPSGFGSCLINTGKTFLVVLDNSTLNEKLHSAGSLKDKKGFCYYVVDKQGEIAFYKNHHYKFHPQITS